MIFQHSVELSHLRGGPPNGGTPRMVKEHLCCLLLTFFLFLQISCIFRESRTFDEILHLEAGLKFWQKGDFTVEPFNPPLAREIVSLPLLINGSLIKDPFLFGPRMVVVFFSVGLATIVYLWSQNLNERDHLKRWSGIFSLLILFFTPEILAHGHFANTDLIWTFFGVLSLFFFDKYFLDTGKTKLRNFLILGIVVGLSLAAKTTAIFFVLLPMVIWWLFFSKKGNKPKVKGMLIFIVTICLVIWSTYFFTLEPVLGYRADPNRQALKLIKKYPRISFLLNTPIPLGSFISTIKQNILSNQTSKFPRDTVFFGKYSQGMPGILIWPLFLIKTPLPLLLLLAISFFRKSKDGGGTFLKLIIILIFFQATFLGANLRLRYFLIVYPLLAVLFGNVLADWWFDKKPWRKIAAVALLLWLMAGTLTVYPHFLTYFNGFVGSRANGYKYVVDSNLDWGQGLPTLKKYVEEKKNEEFQLAYFGNVDPSLYGLDYLRVKDASFRDNKKVLPLDMNKPLAISASCWYYCGYFQNEELKKLQPKILSGQFLLFNF